MSSHNVADEQQRKFDNVKGEQESEVDEYTEWAHDWYGTVLLYYSFIRESTACKEQSECKGLIHQFPKHDSQTHF